MRKNDPLYHIRPTVIHLINNYGNMQIPVGPLHALMIYSKYQLVRTLHPYIDRKTCFVKRFCVAINEPAGLFGGDKNGNILLFLINTRLRGHLWNHHPWESFNGR